ncbi:MAG: CFI-box-CTERM domain-containing protein [Euryarchaeota archaeon]|nr:CFI-box-CTERM domain-containing protein [Euryarchaeota archaeon]
MANADSKEDNAGLILMQNPFGRTFVKIYYSTSPPIADLVRENDGLRLIVREGVVKTSVYVARRFVN